MALNYEIPRVSFLLLLCFLVSANVDLSFGLLLKPGCAESGLSQQEAQALWELAIAAKGGRQRLASVGNMAVSADGDYITHKGLRNHFRREYFYVFPNKYWFYEDYGTDVFGITMRMLNYDANTKYAGPLGGLETILEPIGREPRIKGLDNAALTILLETKWLKPVLLKAHADMIDSRAVDVVEAVVEGRRVDYAFDRKNHLPVRVTFYDVVDGKIYQIAQSLSDYVEVQGINVPQKIRLDEGTADSYRIEFDIGYDENLFLQPPSAKASPLSWKTKVPSGKIRP